MKVLLVIFGLMLVTSAKANVEDKFSTSLSQSRQAAERKVDDGDNAHIVSNVVDSYVTNTHRIKINLETAGNSSTKEIEARLVVYLNNDNGSMIYNINRILSPDSRIPAKTQYKNVNGQTVITTKMYIPVDLAATSITKARLLLLSQQIENGKLGIANLR